MNASGPVLVISLDAAEPKLIEQWMADGTLKNLNSLRSKGGYGRLKSSAKWLAGSPWPTFYTGTNPAEHGLYETTQWNHKKMQSVRVTKDWLPLSPFYRGLDNQIRTIAIDVPMAVKPEPFNGIEIYGWLTYDLLGSQTKETPFSYPEEKLQQIYDKLNFRPVSVKSERWGLQKTGSLLKLRDELVEATHQTAVLAKNLIADEKWDLFMLVLGASHRGGHKLWDLTGTYGRITEKNRANFSNALKDVYVACDEVVGELVDAAPKNAKILVFSLHGMGPQNDRSKILSEFLPKITGNQLDSQRHPTINGGLKKAVTAIKNCIPDIIRSIGVNHDSFVFDMFRFYKSNFSKNVNKTASKPVFSLRTDQNGYVRINLCNREKDGVVESYEQCEKICSDITMYVKSLVDTNTGLPIVDAVLSSKEIFGNGSRLDYLPDLVIRWVPRPFVFHETVGSELVPSFKFSMPNRNLVGRSGNHRPEGFLIAVGEGMPAESSFHDADILDLAPTIINLLGLDKPVQMNGSSLWGNK